MAKITIEELELKGSDDIIIVFSEGLTIKTSCDVLEKYIGEFKPEYMTFTDDFLIDEDGDEVLTMGVFKVKDLLKRKDSKALIKDFLFDMFGIVSNVSDV